MWKWWLLVVGISAFNIALIFMGFYLLYPKCGFNG